MGKPTLKFSNGWKAPTVKHKAYSGATLDAIRAVFAAKSTRKEEWGRYEWGAPKWSAGVDPKTGLVNKLTVKTTTIITMPKWSEYKKQPTADKAIWDKMYKALLAHEKAHHQVCLDVTAALNRRLTAAPPEAGDIQGIMDAYFAELDTATKAFDKRTKHGSGTVKL